MTNDRQNKKQKKEEVKLWNQTPAIFRKSALEKINEHPFIDINKSDYTKHQTIYLFLGVTFVLSIIVVVLFMPIQTTHLLDGRVVWSPPLTVIQSKDFGVIDSVEATTQDNVKINQELARVRPQSSVQSDVDSQARIDLIRDELDSLLQVQNIVSEFHRHLHRVASEGTESANELDQYFETVVASQKHLEKQRDTQLRRSMQLSKKGILASASDELIDQQSDHLLSVIQLAGSQIQALKQHDDMQDRQLRIAELLQDLDQHRHEYEVEIAELSIEHRRLTGIAVGSIVKTPIQGTIVTKTPSIGQDVRPGAILFRIKPEEANPVVEVVLSGQIASQITSQSLAMLDFPFLGFDRRSNNLKDIEKIFLSNDNDMQYILNIPITQSDLPDNINIERFIGSKVVVYIYLPSKRLIDLLAG